MGQMTPLRIAVGITLLGAALLVAGSAAIAGSGVAMLVAGALLLTLGLFGVNFK